MGLLMPRKKTILQSHFPYHIYNRSLDQRFFKVPMATLWKIFSEEAFYASTLWNLQFHSLVLMGNHYHAIVSTPDANISAGMCDFQSEVARRISQYLGRDSYRFQSRYRWSIIANPGHFGSVYKYVYQNPLRAGICARVEDYPFSTLHGLIGSSVLGVPIKSCHLGVELFESSPMDMVTWLNDFYDPSESDRIRKGLKKSNFEIMNYASSFAERARLLEKSSYLSAADGLTNNPIAMSSR
jgi:REP element-mobilizing transposase RayT